jgi:hypothetical protein
LMAAISSSFSRTRLLNVTRFSRETCTRAKGPRRSCIILLLIAASAIEHPGISALRGFY